MVNDQEQVRDRSGPHDDRGTRNGPVREVQAALHRCRHALLQRGLLLRGHGLQVDRRHRRSGLERHPRLHPTISGGREAEAQRVVMSQERGPCLLEHGARRRRRQLEAHLLVVVMRRRPREVEEPVLNREQRTWTDERSLIGARSGSKGHHLREGRYARRCCCNVSLEIVAGLDEGTTYATSRCSPGTSSRSSTTASPTPSCLRNTVSISLSSMR